MFFLSLFSFLLLIKLIQLLQYKRNGRVARLFELVKAWEGEREVVFDCGCRISRVRTSSVVGSLSV